MDQLPHAPVGIAVFVSGVVLRQSLDEDGAQRLVLTVVSCGISIQEEVPATEIIHGCPLEVCVRWFPALSPSGQSYQTGSPGPSRTALRASELGGNEGAGRSPDRIAAPGLPRIG